MIHLTARLSRAWKGMWLGKLVLLIGVAMMLKPGPALAQTTEDPRTIIQASGGWAITNSPATQHSGFAGGLGYAHRLSTRWWLQAMLHRSAWDLASMPASPSSPAASRVSIGSIMIGGIKMIETDGLAQAYVGGGVGTYRFRFVPDEGRAVWKPGGFVAVGAQFPQPTARYGGFVEFRLNIVRAPEASALQTYFINVAVISLGFKVAF